MRIIAIGFFALAFFPAISSAQQSQRSAAVGPTIESAAIGFRAPAATDAELNAAQLRRRAGPDVALMVVGVGAMVVGAIVGGDAGTIILIGGAALALWGLYNYLE
jgi:hypothetical protein